MPLPNVINIVLWSGFLDVADRSSYSMVCVNAAEKLLSTESILEGISHCPVPDSCRFNFWRWAIGRDFDYDIFEPLHGGDTLGYYLHHRALLSSTTTKKSPGQLGEIMRDVGRTYPDHPFFDTKKNQPGEHLLARVLCATLSSTPNIGYCQGMNFVVGTLLLARVPNRMIEASLRREAERNREGVNIEEEECESSVSRGKEVEEGCIDSLTSTTAICNLNDSSSISSQYDDIEADVFWMFQSILIKNDRGLEMEFIWKPSFPKMKLRVFQFDRLLALHLPALHAHFEDINLSPEVVISQWFMTLFSNTLPLHFTFHMWDYIFVSAWPGVFRATMAILYVLQENILEMDLEEVGLLIRDWKRGNFSIPVTFSELLCSAETFEINGSSLVMLQENYALEMIVAAIGDDLDVTGSVGKSYHGGCMGLPRPGGDSWLRRYGEFPAEMRNDMLTIHNEINEMSVQVDRDKAVLQNKILKACELCENAYEDLDKAIREEMQWLQYTSNLKHDLSSWEQKAKIALSELQAVNEVEKEGCDESGGSNEEGSEEDYYTGSSDSSSGGEYVDDGETNSSGEEYDDEDDDSADSSCDSHSSVSDGRPDTATTAGSNFFFDAVSNMTSMLIPISPTSAAVSTAASTSLAARNQKVEIPHNNPLLSLRNDGLVVAAVKPQQTERDDVSPHHSSHSSTKSSSPELNKLPVTTSADILAEKIKAHPHRRRSTSGIKQHTSSPTTSPTTTPTSGMTNATPVETMASGHEVDVGEAARNHSTADIPTPPSVIDVAKNTPQLQDVTTTVSPGSPKAPTRFQNFKSSLLKKTRSGERLTSNLGGGSRSVFSRRYLAAKLAKRKKKMMKLKECQFLHKQIIKSTKQFEIAKKRLLQAKENKQMALLADEEAKQWKDSLCGQFSTLVKEADRLRSQKLIYIVDTYGM